MSRNQRRGMPRSGRVAIVGAVATTFVLAACGDDGGDTTEGNGEEKEVTITLGTEFPPQQPASQAIDKAVELVDEYTNGTVTIEHFHSGEIGAHAELAERLMTGDVDMNVQSMSYFVDQFPKSEFDSMYYAYDDLDHVHRFWESDLAADFAEEMIEATGVRVLGPWYYGNRVFTTKETPIRTPDDLKGLSIRVPDIPLSVKSVQAMGASPVPMAFGEVFLALSQGVIDGQENPPSVVTTLDLQNVQGYLSMTNHDHDVIYPLINEELWQSLSESQQEGMMKAFQEAGVLNDELVAEREEEGLTLFRDAGGTIVEDVDVDAFRQLVVEGVFKSPEYEHVIDFWQQIRDMA